METLSENACFGGVQGVYRHASAACQCDMTFGLFLPAEAKDGPVPVLWYLSGLTCTHENAMTKAGAQAWAAEQGIAVVFPDTSPRGEGVADHDDYDLGQGAGFYVNATQAPWAPHFNMWDYVAEELPALLTENFAIDMRPSGDHRPFDGRPRCADAGDEPAGAVPVGLGLRADLEPDRRGLGSQTAKRLSGRRSGSMGQHDASVLMKEKGFDGPILIDTGANDQFIDLLRPETLAQAIAERRQQATYPPAAGL